MLKNSRMGHGSAAKQTVPVFFFSSGFFFSSCLSHSPLDFQRVSKSSQLGPFMAAASTLDSPIASCSFPGYLFLSASKGLTWISEPLRHVCLLQPFPFDHGNKSTLTFFTR